MENCGKGVRKGAWTKEEDTLLKNCIEKYGEGKWHQVPLRAGLNRCRKSCRLRWLNYLRPDIKRGYFTKDEVDLLIRLHKLLGNRWSLIAGRLPGRTANDVKNFWNTHMSNKSAAAGEGCRRPKTTLQKAITKANIIKPRPRTLSIPLLQVPACPSEAARTNDENPNKKLPSSPASLSQEEPNDGKMNCSGNLENNPQPSPSFSREEVDECNLWWSSLLEITESGEGTTSFSFSDVDGLGGPENSHVDLDGFSGLSIDADVWEHIRYQ